MTRKSADRPLRIWALLGARPGDNDQVIALAEAIGLPFDVKRLEYNGLRWLGPALLGKSLASLAAGSRELVLGEPPPDVTISTGHRSVPVVRALKSRSHGQMRAIHVGFPRVSPAHFDLVIATPQYPIPDNPSLLRVPFALTRTATATPDPADLGGLSGLPSPRRLLIVGGPTLFWELDRTALDRTLAGLLDEARGEGGSVLVTTSARTPAEIANGLDRSLETSGVPSILAEPGRAPGYAALLASADRVWVTADSVSMLSDALWTGKDVATIPIRKSMLGRVAFAFSDRLRPGRPIYPQDLRFFWDALSNLGVSGVMARPRVSGEKEMRAILERVGTILETSPPTNEPRASGAGRGQAASFTSPS